MLISWIVLPLRVREGSTKLHEISRTTTKDDFPSCEWFYCAAGWTAVLPSASNASLKQRVGIRQRPFNHVRRDSSQRYFQTTTPGRFGLPGASSNVDVDEALAGRAMHEVTQEIWCLRGGPHANCEFKGKVFPFRSLLLNRFITIALTLLHTEVDARKRFLQNYSQRKFVFHCIKSNQQTVNGKQQIIGSIINCDEAGY